MVEVIEHDDNAYQSQKDGCPGEYPTDTGSHRKTQTFWRFLRRLSQLGPNFGLVLLFGRAPLLLFLDVLLLFRREFHEKFSLGNYDIQNRLKLGNAGKTLQQQLFPTWLPPSISRADSAMVTILRVDVRNYDADVFRPLVCF